MRTRIEAGAKHKTRRELQLERVRLYSFIKNRRGESNGLSRPLRLAVGITALLVQGILETLGFVRVFFLLFFIIKASFKSVYVCPFKQVFGKLIKNFTEHSQWALNIASLFEACVIALPLQTHKTKENFRNLQQMRQNLTNKSAT